MIIYGPEKKSFTFKTTEGSSLLLNYIKELGFSDKINSNLESTNDETRNKQREYSKE